MAYDSFKKTPETDRKRIDVKSKDGLVRTIHESPLPNRPSTINRPTVIIPKPRKDLHPGISPGKKGTNR